MKKLLRTEWTWLLLWWLVPAFLSFGKPGWPAAFIAIVALLAIYLLNSPLRSCVAIWMPLVLFAGTLALGSTFALGWVILLLFSGGAGPWVAGLIIVFAGGAIAVAAFFGVPLFVSLVRMRPKESAVHSIVIAIANTAFLVIVSGQLIASPYPRIDFYGIAVDQENHPLPDVEIRYVESPGPWGYRPEKPSLYSGVDGRFHITGVSGSSLFIMIFKSGYELKNREWNSTFSFSDRRAPNFYSGSINHPVVFSFAKKSPH